MSQHVVYTFSGQPEQLDILVALLAHLPFEGFEEIPGAIVGYVPDTTWTEDAAQQVVETCNKLGIEIHTGQLEDQNWNALWESNFTPVIIPEFVMVRADFHEMPPENAFRHVVTINPRMAFGTGHHPTTKMMLLEMDALTLDGCSVLDYGCGTGILSMMASRMGAKDVLAIDIDPNSTENTILNAKRNDCVLEVSTGDLDCLSPTAVFDVVLANINRNVLLEALPTLYTLTKSGGQVLLSGFLETDIPVLRKHIDTEKWTERPYRRDGGWVCLPITRTHP